VVNNSTKYYKNFITINRGTDAGLEPGMAVISSGSVVGKIKSVSRHYAVLISLLNLDEQVSGMISARAISEPWQWEGNNSSAVNLKYIPRHVQPTVG